MGRAAALSSISGGTRPVGSPSSSWAKEKLSAATLARVAAIRESSERHGTKEGGGEGFESDEEEEEGLGVEASDLVRKTLSVYYQNLESGGNKGGICMGRGVGVPCVSSVTACRVSLLQGK